MKVKFRFYVIIFILILILCVVGLLTLPWFNTQHVELHGTERADDEIMAQLLEITKGKNIFRVNRDQLRKEVEKDPYLIYKRTWFKFPNRVVINVEERHPQYYLEHLGNYLAVSSQGFVLSASKEQQVKNIPMVKGLRVTSFTIGQRIKTEEDISLIALNRIMEKFEESGMTYEIVEIDVNDVVHITMLSKQGHKIIFGTSDQIERKIEWIYSLLKQIENQGLANVVIDVSSPDNPSYNVAKTTQAPTEQTTAATTAKPSSTATTSAKATTSSAGSNTTSAKTTAKTTSKTTAATTAAR